MYLKIFWKKIVPILPFIFVIAFTILAYNYVDTQRLLNWIGLENAYLMMYLISFAGGLTTFNFIPYYSVIILLVSAGLPPVYVGIASALGIMSGDTFSYFMGYSGSKVIPEKYKLIFERIAEWAKRKPKLFIFGSFLYGTFCPLPNDFITVPSGIAKIPYRKIMIPLMLGNLIFNIGVAYISLYGDQYLKLIFG
jgi:membrane protein DedA with SNARE-associated domain